MGLATKVNMHRITKEGINLFKRVMGVRQTMSQLISGKRYEQSEMKALPWTRGFCDLYRMLRSGGAYGSGAGSRPELSAEPYSSMPPSFNKHVLHAESQ